MNGYILVHGLPACKGHANRLRFNARDAIPGSGYMQGMHVNKKSEQLPDGYIKKALTGELYHEHQTDRLSSGYAFFPDQNQAYREYNRVSQAGFRPLYRRLTLLFPGTGRTIIHDYSLI